MRVTRSLLSSLGAAAMLALAATAAADTTTPSDRGRYLVAISGCNDCHTPGYPESGGKLLESQWLTGSAVGFQGPWGTTYPTNLRRYVRTVSEDEWAARVRQPMRPPMPWFSLAAMSEGDVRAIYRFIRGLGETGKPAPDYAAPGQPVATPYFEFVPKNLPLPPQAVR